MSVGCAVKVITGNEAGAVGETVNIRVA